MSAATYSVILHHLSPDAKQAAAGQPDHPMASVTVVQLEVLLNNLAALAPTMQEDPSLSPELRIQTSREELQVRATRQGLRIDSWDSKLAGLYLTPGEILSIIGGKQPAVPKRPRHVSSTPGAGSGGGSGRWLKIGALAVAIIAVNATTVWLFFSPPNTLLPRHELLADSETRQIFANLAGEYETGGAQGDRRLIIAGDGTIRVGLYGAKRAVVRENPVNARGARVEGVPALITLDPPSVLQIKDTNTLVLYGDTYKRRPSAPAGS